MDDVCLGCGKLNLSRGQEQVEGICGRGSDTKMQSEDKQRSDLSLSRLW